MSKIPLTGGFKPLDEGVYIFKVDSVKYDEKFGKLTIKFVTKDGKTHSEQFGFLTDKGKPNDGAMNAFSFLAKTLLNDFDREEVDEEELVGRFVKCSIEHQVVEGNDGRVRTYAHLGKDKTVAYGFDEEEEQPAEETAEKPKTDMDSLKALLGLE